MKTEIKYDYCNYRYVRGTVQSLQIAVSLYKIRFFRERRFILSVSASR